jgi:hypothetical protein
MLALPKDPDAFFGVWLPQSFERLLAKLGEMSSLGAVVFHVGDRPPTAVRLQRGALVVAREVPNDVIVQVSLVEQDFEPILVRSAERVADAANPDQQLAMFRALTLDAERIELIRQVPGRVAFVLSAAGQEHRVLLTPGRGVPDLSAAECSVRCALDDFLAMQRGEANPFELLMNGKIQISGDAQIPMALSSLLV